MTYVSYCFISIKADLEEIVWEVVDCIYLAQDVRNAEFRTTDWRYVQ
jgi:hypothetical protein